MNAKNDPTIVIIGPTGVGKTTTARNIAQCLGRRQVSVDDTRHTYLKETAFDKSFSDALKKHCFESVIRYWERFNAHVVLRTLSEHSGAVIDFGAIHSVYDDPFELQKIYRQMKGCYCVLLLPHPDKEHSLQFLLDRGREPNMTHDQVEMWTRIIRRFITNPSNYLLSSAIIYTENKKVEEIASEIISRYTSWHLNAKKDYVDGRQNRT